ncbi:unnamed protein product (macronuclear) [Paramecium tetraurelia]|uniref:Uncharacterized protein n=1 Tax=Paramecium tetraurelia TaxID=5888 RepID=A0E2E0_PARTE|nr:uncharacterized protein GSPATT00022629001 [Paramecium tetraurelia]CAK89457.1 unnamed protein product [Paramecium tetraurelia]|eukprot:XP_001456854.1 hypothetical protein (macronuclear) [Paramecium tetraurelia strain d4-2]
MNSKKFVRTSQCYNPSFNIGSNYDCIWLYDSKPQFELEKLSQIQILLNNNSPSLNYCPICQNKTFYVIYRQVVDAAYEEVQFRIIDQISQTYQQQDSNEILQIMFLSNEEEEKKKVFYLIQENCSTENSRQRSNFEQTSIINNKYRFHNPPLFDFEKDSENTITTFRDYFSNNSIHFFFIFIKFERTDIMIQRITKIIKKIYHLERNRIALIVNQCECEQYQKLELQKRFSYFGFKTIEFFSNDSPQDICNALFKTLENVDAQRFDFSNTIFEQENEIADQQQQQMKENLINVSKQIEADQIQKFKTQMAQDKEQQEILNREIRDLEETLYKKREQQRDISYKIRQDQQELYDWERQYRKFKY